jgi:hypothetical protein
LNQHIFGDSMSQFSATTEVEGSVPSTIPSTLSKPPSFSTFDIDIIDIIDISDEHEPEFKIDIVAYQFWLTVVVISNCAFVALWLITNWLLAKSGLSNTHYIIIGLFFPFGIIYFMVGVYSYSSLYQKYRKEYFKDIHGLVFANITIIFIIFLITLFITMDYGKVVNKLHDYDDLKYSLDINVTEMRGGYDFYRFSNYRTDFKYVTWVVINEQAIFLYPILEKNTVNLQVYGFYVMTSTTFLYPREVLPNIGKPYSKTPLLILSLIDKLDASLIFNRMIINLPVLMFDDVFQHQRDDEISVDEWHNKYIGGVIAVSVVQGVISIITLATINYH